MPRDRAAPSPANRPRPAPAPKPPTASLGFLVLAYSVLGWSIADVWKPAWLWWSLAILVGLSLSMVLSVPIAYWRSPVLRWFESELVSFFSVFVGAFTVVLLLAWIHFLLVGLLLFSAMALARLDLLTARFTPWQSFLILATASQVGLALGWMLHWLTLI